MQPLIRSLIAIILGPATYLIVGLAEVDAQKPDKPAPERVKLVRQMYEKVPPIIFELAEPLQLVKATMYEDGGTIVVDFKDAKGKPFAMILDRRIGSPTRESMFIRFMSSSQRKLVLLRGPEEAALYSLLLRWSATPESDHWTRVSANALLDHLDQRFAGEAAGKQEPTTK